MFFTHIDPIIKINTEERLARCASIELLNTPPLLDECFQLLKDSGAKYFALFGGAIRDADYAARHNQTCQIKDYDLRIWLPLEDDYDQQVQQLITNIETITSLVVQEIPSLGTGKIRYCLNYKEVEFDISIRHIPECWQNKSIPSEAVAIDRACNSDAGICSVAIDSDKKAWALPEYTLDQTRKTLTIYPNPDAERKHAFAKKMKNKFPNHKMIELYASKLAGQILSDLNLTTLVTTAEIGISAELNQATIYTARLELSSINQYETSYLNETYRTLLQDELNTKMFREGRVWTDNEINELINDQLRDWNSGKRFSAFLVHKQVTHEPVGILFVDYSIDHFKHVGSGHLNTAEIGYMVLPQHGGLKFGTEMTIAGKKYISHLLHILPLEGKPPIREIGATVHPGNKASKAILTKTLKRHETEETHENGYFEFQAYGNQPRNYFYKPLKQEKYRVIASEEKTISCANAASL